jgi:RNA polymerase sigma factor (sigma-70 family)
MNVHISYKIQRTPDIDEEIQHWTTKVQKRLQVFRPELIHLKGLVDQNSGREQTTVSLNLRLPSGQLAAQESAPNAASAIKAAFDDLLGQIGRHKDLLRNTHRGNRRRILEKDQTPQVPFEETIASVALTAASTEEIRSYVNANFRRLRLFVERQLLLRESTGDLDPDWIAPEEIVDEAVARALDETIEKPDRLGIEAWLYRLALAAMNDIGFRLRAGAGEVDLYGVRRRRNERASDEPRFQFHQPDEAMTTESGIPDRNAATPEEIAYTDEMFSLVQYALKGAAPQDRESFILHALEGFSIAEIAAITDRPLDQVKQAIHRAREKLRRAFPINGMFKKRLLQETGTQ